MYAVPLRYLHQFLDNTGDIILKCKFADMYLRRFLSAENLGNTSHGVPSEDDEFLYHYRSSEKQEFDDAPHPMRTILEQFILALSIPHIMPIKAQTNEETKQRTIKGVIDNGKLDQHFRTSYVPPPLPWAGTSMTLNEQREAYVKMCRGLREKLKNELKQVVEGVTLLKVTPAPK